MSEPFSSPGNESPNNRRGRPPLPADRKLTREVSVSFTDDEYAKLLQASAKSVTKVQTWIRRALASHLVDGGQDDLLTQREREVMSLVAEGHSNKIIADKLDISSHTAKFHVTNVMRKLGVDNRAGVAAVAVRLGLA